jgi:NADH:ubiquinone oxidoreductase subunit 5 (subunit L)/multisubunit Na+/H+ antiporter MnhA subunit
VGGIGLLALTGGLAALCFARLIGIVLLGEPRSEPAARAHEPPFAMVAPLIALAALCLGGALAPRLVVRLHTPVIETLVGGSASPVLAAASLVQPVALCNAGLIAILVIACAVVALRSRRRVSVETWGCGYAGGSPRVQYTGRSFAELLVGGALPRWLRPLHHVRPPEGLFPTSASFSSDTTDPMTRAAYEPLLARLGDRFAWLRWLQQGSLHAYLVYIATMTILGLAWVSVRKWGWP